MLTDDLAHLWTREYETLTPEELEARRAYCAQFTRGRRFRARQPFTLWGMQPSGPWSQTSWRLAIPPGTILTCAGESMTFGDGVPAIKWTDADGNYLAIDCCVDDIVGGMWGGQIPRPGLLKPLDP